MKKNKESFISFKDLFKIDNPKIFSFGCGIGLDGIAVKEVFSDNAKYYGIDKCEWAITKTQNYKDFQPNLPKVINYGDGILYLSIAKKDVVVCFFNSLFTISNDVNLMDDLVKALITKENFFILCDWTINSNYHLPKTEKDFLNKFCIKLSSKFTFKSFEILDGKGIIICGESKQ